MVAERASSSSWERILGASLASALSDSGHKVGTQAALITRWDCKLAVQLDVPTSSRTAMDARLETSYIDVLVSN
ncbi:unnamed protein product [Lasius platythorax]|uniref:Uncharacterized protein n=1 Tax=Lasius platythorax TaxID=488582 RepID=A0AAV2NZU7_9HYME